MTQPGSGFLRVFDSLREPCETLARPQWAVLRKGLGSLLLKVTICCSRTTSERTKPYLDLTVLGFGREARGERRGGAGQGSTGSTGSTGRAAREEQGGEVGFQKCRKLRAKWLLKSRTGTNCDRFLSVNSASIKNGSELDQTKTWNFAVPSLVYWMEFSRQSPGNFVFHC